MNKKVVLLILDGWGIGKQDNSDAIFNAKTPFVDSLADRAANATLKTFGAHVGLPDGQMGNSEVGHMNIGAGRVVWQMLVRINKVFEENRVLEIANFQKMVDLAKAKPTRKIHLMGLVSDGGVHSSLEHLKALNSAFTSLDLDDRVYVHAFTDGRDTDPHNGVGYIEEVIKANGFGRAKLASVCGRYYAMDRDKRWERTAVAYNALVRGEGARTDNVLETLKSRYAINETDEFIQPIISNDYQAIAEDDIVLCFNFRTDRGRQISTALTQESMPDFGMKILGLNYFTMTEYDKTFKDVNVLFDSQDLTNTLGEVLAAHNKKQLRAAETEKYPHVTFFFNGGREEPFVGEDRTMASSPKVATYDLQPEMSAVELTEKVMLAMRKEPYDFVCVNYANPDMVGHTGVYDAIVKACETVDSCAEAITEYAQKEGYSVIVIADHGNADKVLNEDGSPHTAHTTNLVPIYILDSDIEKVNDGKLADLAPSILKMMGIERPKDMDGFILV